MPGLLLVTFLVRADELCIGQHVALHRTLDLGLCPAKLVALCGGGRTIATSMRQAKLGSRQNKGGETQNEEDECLRKLPNHTNPRRKSSGN